MSSVKGLSVIIPVYNEERIIVKNTKKLIKFLKKLRVRYEVILCDNGSADATAALGKKLQRQFKNVKLISIPERGVGLAFREAVLASSYSSLVSVDMDLAVDLNFIPRCVKLLKNSSMVVGSKIVGSQERSFYRKILSDGYIFLTKLLLGLNFSDYSIGAKGYRKDDVIDKIHGIDSGSFYVTEFIYFMKRKNRKVVEIPVSCHDRRKSKFSLRSEVSYRLKSLLSLWLRERIIARIIKTPA